MSGLSQELYQRCRTILLRCSEFDSDASLRAVFVTDELHPFRGGLPEAASKSERVDKVWAYLLDKRLRDSRPVLPLFLAALRDRYQRGDDLRNELETLRIEVERELSAPIKQSEMQEPIFEVEHSAAYSPDKLPGLAQHLANSYNVMELTGLARFLNMYVSALPRDKLGMSQEIVLFANRQGRLDELILRLKMDGKP